MNATATVSIGASGLRWLWISLLVVVADQLSKLWIERTMVLGDSFTVLSILDIVRAHNYGAAFSFLDDAGGWQRWALRSLSSSSVPSRFSGGRPRPQSAWPSPCSASFSAKRTR